MMVTPSPYDAVVPRTCAAASCQSLTLHALRHTFASHLVMRGAQLLAVKELLGHQSMSQVLQYANLGPKNITRDAIRPLDGDDKVETG